MATGLEDEIDSTERMLGSHRAKGNIRGCERVPGARLRWNVILNNGADLDLRTLREAHVFVCALASADQAATARAAEDCPRCFHCGCTDEQPCPGGCLWVPGPMDGELCSRCLALLTLVAAALDDAAGWRDLRSSAPCEACTSAAGGHCAEHQADEDLATAYRELLAARYSTYLPDSIPAGAASAILHAD